MGVQIFLSTPVDYMTSKKYHWAHKLPGGVLGETGPHAVYLALAFLKDVYDVDVRAKKLIPDYPWSDFEDFRITLVAKNGMGSVVLAYGTNQWVADIDIIGSKGILKVDLQARSVVIYNRPRLTAAFLGLSVLKSVLAESTAIIKNGLSHVSHGWQDAHAIGIDNFIDSICSNKASPIVPEEAREVVRLLEMTVARLNKLAPE